MEDVKMAGEEAREILWGNEDEYQVIEDVITGHSRWSRISRIVIQRLSDSAYFVSEYGMGATENQDELPWEYGDAVFQHVVPVVKTITVYERP